MEKKSNKVKQKTKNCIDKIKKPFEDKNKRYLYMFLFILPFVIAIGFFGYVTYKEAKNLKNLLSGGSEIREEFRIDSMGYYLRDNATQVQQDYFAQLKKAVEVDNASDEEISGLVCKNFIADFYTWSNKQGQYDIGGMSYVFDIEETKTNTYMQARDGFYKYLSNYIKQYGSENLLEVADVQVVSTATLPYEYKCLVNTHCYDEEIGHFYKDIEHDFEPYKVKCTWTYKESQKFPTDQYVTSMTFIVVENCGRYEIVEANEKDIDGKSSSFKYEDEVEVNIEESEDGDSEVSE